MLMALGFLAGGGMKLLLGGSRPPLNSSITHDNRVFSICRSFHWANPPCDATGERSGTENCLRHAVFEGVGMSSTLKKLSAIQALFPGKYAILDLAGVDWRTLEMSIFEPRVSTLRQ
jgi:hypothetical protein